MCALGTLEPRTQKVNPDCSTAHKSRGPVVAPTIPLPANQILRIFHQHDLILFQYRQQDVLQLALPKFPFIKLCFHRLTRRKIREAAHPEEGVGIFDGKKWTQYFHPDFRVRRNGPGAEYLQELGALAGLGFIRAHFDDHSNASASRLARRAEKSKNALCGNPVTLWKLVRRQKARVCRNRLCWRSARLQRR